MGKHKTNTPGYHNTFGYRLRKSRRDRGLSQTAVAGMLGYKHHCPISTMETNRTNPNLETLRALATALNVDLNWLIAGTRPQRLALATSAFLAATEDVTRELDRRISEKGPGAFVSRHEILGIVGEEYSELVEAVHRAADNDVRRELLDIAVACIFGVASLDAH